MSDDTFQPANGGGISRGIRTYALRSGRMTDAQKKAYGDLSLRWRIPFKNEALDFAAVFGNDAPVTVEVGFGMGQATAEIAQANPDKNYMGIDVYKAGVGRLLSEIERRGLSNLRIIEHDALTALEAMIPDSSVAAFHVFFPDPWPKKRHHKRRLMLRPRTELFAQKLTAGGYIFMATDWKPYAEEAMLELAATPRLKNAYSGFAPPQAWRPKTAFEKKGEAQGREIFELIFIKEET